MKLSRIFTPSLLRDGIAFVAGILLTLSFAPFHLYPLALLSSASLLWTWLAATPQKAFFRGFLYGLGLYGSGVYWVYISIHQFGSAPIPLAVAITGCFIAILALFPASNGYLLNRYFPKNNAAKCVFAFPVIWFLLEWVRNWIFSGFPWLMIGYSQIDSPLRGYAPILSVYGVSLMTVLSAGLLVNIIMCSKQPSQQRTQPILISVLALVIIWVTGVYLSKINWSQQEGQPVQVALIQGNIPQNLKWSPEEVQPTLDRYESLSAPYWKNDIIVWPEAAIPLTLEEASGFLGKMADKAKEQHATLITGIPIKIPESESYFNSVIAVGAGEGIYLKHRLVPFGEYTPMPRFTRPILDNLNIPMSDFIPDLDPALPLYANNLKISSFICYEIAFAEQVRLTDDNVRLILTVSNDAWFGHSIAQAQHLQMGQMRALENGRPVLFVSNDGLTASVGPTGKIQAIAPAHQPFALVDTVQPMKGKTPWQRWKTDPVFGTALVLLFVGVRRRNK